MNGTVDPRGKLHEQPFETKLIATLLDLDERGDEASIQLALAKVTGNFKRGNERL